MTAYQMSLDGHTVRTRFRVRNPDGKTFRTFYPSSYEDEWTSEFSEEWTMIVAREGDGYIGCIRDDRYGVYYHGVTAGDDPADVARALISETARRA